MEETLHYTELYDLYGSLLTERQRSIFEDYFFENLTLEEIAQFDGVSKSSTAKTIKQIKVTLDETEKNLHFLEYMKKIKAEFEDELDILNRLKKYDNIVL